MILDTEHSNADFLSRFPVKIAVETCSELQHYRCPKSLKMKLFATQRQLQFGNNLWKNQRMTSIPDRSTRLKEAVSWSNTSGASY